MLTLDPIDRPSFPQLKKMIPEMFSQVGKNGSLQLSLVKEGSSRLIEVDHSQLRESKNSSLSVSSLGSMMSASRVFASSFKTDKTNQ